MGWRRLCLEALWDGGAGKKRTCRAIEAALSDMKPVNMAEPQVKEKQLLHFPLIQIKGFHFWKKANACSKTQEENWDAAGLWVGVW